MMRLALLAALALGAATAYPMTTPARAQEAAPTTNDQWLKFCSTDQAAQKEVCLITQELRTPNGQFLASIAIRETPGEARKSLLASVPVGMLLRPGVRLQVDGGEATEMPFSICYPNACYAELAIDNGFVNQLKAGGKLQMTTLNQQAKPVRFDLTLIGFTATYDGEGMNPDEIQAERKRLQDELNRRAQEARDRLVAEQRRAIDEQTDGEAQ